MQARHFNVQTQGENDAILESNNDLPRPGRLSAHMRSFAVQLVLPASETVIMEYVSGAKTGSATRSGLSLRPLDPARNLTVNLGISSTLLSYRSLILEPAW